MSTQPEKWNALDLRSCFDGKIVLEDSRTWYLQLSLPLQKSRVGFDEFLRLQESVESQPVVQASEAVEFSKVLHSQRRQSRKC